MAEIAIGIVVLVGAIWLIGFVLAILVIFLRSPIFWGFAALLILLSLTGVFDNLL